MEVDSCELSGKEVTQELKLGHAGTLEDIVALVKDQISYKQWRSQDLSFRGTKFIIDKHNILYIY
jgi:hypothetical protein